MKQKFRTSKDFKALEKLTKSLQRYFNMNLPSDLQNLAELIPENSYDELYLPARNLVNYILVRIQGASKLMEYIIETCVDIASMLIMRIQTGHFWKIGFILFSIVSRVYVLSRHTTKTLCNFYSQLLPISKKLQNEGKQWLPENYIFPHNLENWLEIDLLKMDKEFQKIHETISVPDILNYFNLVEDSDSDVAISDEYILLKDDKEVINISTEMKERDKSLSKRMLSELNSSEDIGEIIEIMSDGHNERDDVIISSFTKKEIQPILKVKTNKKKKKKKMNAKLSNSGEENILEDRGSPKNVRKKLNQVLKIGQLKTDTCQKIFKKIKTNMKKSKKDITSKKRRKNKK